MKKSFKVFDGSYEEDGHFVPQFIEESAEYWYVLRADGVVCKLTRMDGCRCYDMIEVDDNIKIVFDEKEA